MKPFNLEEAKAGIPVCTRNGDDVIILDFNRKDLKEAEWKKPIVAKVEIKQMDGDSFERVYEYSADGRLYADLETGSDLMIKTQMAKMYVNYYKTGDDSFYIEGFSGKEDARVSAESFVNTTKGGKYIRTEEIMFDI